MNLTAQEEQRFRSKFTETPSGCWQWQQPLDRDGYGAFYFRRMTRRAHRVAYYWRHGEIPEGMMVNHTCQNRACVNPSHLNLKDAAGNALNNSRSVTAINAQKTHCKHGHLLDGTYRQRKKNGTISVVRFCRTCARAKSNRLSQKWRAENTLRV